VKVRTLALRNFKAFHGEHRLDLPDVGPDRPLYLVGGLNGAGKTSLSQAVVLCLHGERAAGLPGLFRGGRDQRKNYQQWLEAAFNRRARFGGDDHMMTRLDLDLGDRGRAAVTRSWWFQASGDAAEEQIEARLTPPGGGDELLVGADAQRAVDELFPRHLLDFAVFDGEQVRRLDDTLSAPAVQAALDRLLELEPVARARQDLLRMAEERRLRHADEKQHAAYASMLRQRDDLAGARSAAVSARAAADRHLDRLRVEIDEVNARVHQHLSGGTDGADAASAAQLRARRAELVSRLGRAVGEWAFVLPAADELGPLAARAEELRGKNRERERAKLEIEAVESLAEALASDSALRKSVGRPPVTAVARWIRASAAARRASLDEASSAAADPLDALSDSELAEAEGAARAAVQRDRSDLAALARELGRVDARLADAAVAPDGPGTAAEQLLRRRDELSVELGRAQTRREQLAEQVDGLDSELASLRAQLGRIEQRLSVDPDDAEWLGAAERTAAALGEFVDVSRARAIEQVQQTMVGGLRVLLRKTHLVHDVQIDPATHTARLIGPDGEDVELPSAAEHQLAAMAFIEAVLSASRAPLPVFIDTPLARLDSHHRQSVVGRFWPSLGRQIVVLSTDEEVAGDLLRIAGPHVAQTYLVECGPDGDSTIAAGRYLEDAR
jgi:DNA sulfur modification protein DndD